LAHSRSGRELDRREAAVAAELKAIRDDFEAKAATSARGVVAAWNARIAGSKAAEFFPTIRTAIISGHHRLNYYCSSCQQIGAIDVREVADKHHQRAPISVLIPSLSCKRCSPNPPLATLLDLKRPTGYSGHRLSEFPFDPVRIACRRCKRVGQYGKARLIERFGPDIVGPDLIRRLANCHRQSSMSNPCGAHYADLEGSKV
jgi:hypothetical protein